MCVWPSQAKPLLATDPRHAGHIVPSDRAPALRPGTALRMQRCAWQKRLTPAVLLVAQAWRGRVGVRLRTRSLPAGTADAAAQDRLRAHAALMVSR